MPRRTLEAQLAELRDLCDTADAADLRASLSRALASSTNVLVAKAASAVLEHRLDSLSESLIQAFDRFLHLPAAKDKGCAAKVSCVLALIELAPGPGEVVERVFQPGSKHVQMEPVWGKSVDTAGELRGLCAIGLLRSGYPRALITAGDRLADPEPAARSGAARGLGECAGPEAVPLLRLAIRRGEAHHDVLVDLFLALLTLDPEHGLAFVAGHLDHADASSAAAVAIGQSHHDDALPTLQRWHEATLDLDARLTAVLAISMIRNDAARAFLLQRITDAPEPEAAEAIRALGMFQHERGLRERVEQAADRASLQPHIQTAFSP